MGLEIDFKDINWKQTLKTVGQVLMDPKVLGCVIGIGLVIWQSNETFFVPANKTMELRQQALAEQQKLIQERKQSQGQFNVWQRELKGLSTTLIKLSPGDNAQVVALSKSSELVELANKVGGNPDDPNALPPPHDKLTGVSITARGNSTVDIMPKQAEGAEGSAPDSRAGSGAPTSVKLEKFDYEMKMKGTYVALTHFINELVSRENLVVLNEIVMSKPLDEEEPDPLEFPDYPVPVEMTLKFSLLLFDPEKH